MKIGMQTWGSDGDIRPFIALAGGLSSAGHSVTLAYTSVDNKEYSSLADTLNVRLVRAGKDFEFTPELMEKLTHCVLKERQPLKQFAIISDEMLEPAVDDMYAASAQLCKDSDVMIGHWIVYPVSAAAEKSGTPYISVMLNHNGIPSRNVTPSGAPYLGVWANPLWWWIARKLINRTFMPDIRTFRVSQELPPVKDVIQDIWESKLLNLIAVSPAFCVKQNDWGDHHNVTGYLTMPDCAEEWLMPRRLRDFIDAGPPPVYITFGSLMPMDRGMQKEVIDVMIAAVHLAKCRAIVQSSLNDVSDVPEYRDIYYIGKTPHNRIFPHCAAVVHHGGAGTTHSVTRAGCPSIVVEHLTDQLFWGRELKRLGIALEPLHARSLTAEKLAKTIRMVLDAPHMKQKAEEISETMKNEDGVRRAAELIENVFE